MSFDEELQRENRNRVVAIAEGILDGKIGIIEGSRILAGLRLKVSGDSFDPDFIDFVAIASETDHLPVGPVRKEWAPDSLAKKDVEMKDTEDFYRERTLAACKKLIQRFGEPV
jgi:hypothetical protein